MLYGFGVDAVVGALQNLDPRYVLVDRVVPQFRRVAVLRCRDGAVADAAREAAPGVAWLVVELYRPGADVQRARDPLLRLNTSKVDPEMALARLWATDVCSACTSRHG